VALAFGIPQVRALRADQKRIADEISRRPKFSLYFPPRREIETTTRLAYPGEPFLPPGPDDLAPPQMVRVSILNGGTRAATLVNVNLAIAARVRPADLEQAPATDRRSQIAFRLNYDEATLIAAYYTAHIHSDDVSTIDLPLRFPYRNDVYKLRVTINCAEIPRAEATLFITTEVASSAVYTA
jgi:hypothetical protein